MKKRAGIGEIALVLFYAGLGFASALLWFRLLTSGMKFLPYLSPDLQAQVPRLDQWHQDMVSGAAPAPNQYRILTPWFVEYVLLRLAPGASVYGAYMVARALFTGLTLWCFDRYLRAWFSRGAAAAGALCLAAVIPFTYFAVFQESDPLNLLVVVAAFWCLTRKRDACLIPLVLVGTLNRETTLMIPAVYALARWGEEPGRKVALHTALLTLCWAAVFGGLHVGFGPRANYTEAIMLRQNLASFMPTLFAFLVFGVLWVLPWLAPKEAPALLRRSLWLVPPFVALHYIVAVVQEVRLFLPLAPILIPLSWWVLFPEARLTATAPPKAAARR